MDVNHHQYSVCQSKPIPFSLKKYRKSEPILSLLCSRLIGFPEMLTGLQRRISDGLMLGSKPLFSMIMELTMARTRSLVGEGVGYRSEPIHKTLAAFLKSLLDVLCQYFKVKVTTVAGSTSWTILDGTDLGSTTLLKEGILVDKLEQDEYMFRQELYYSITPINLCHAMQRFDHEHSLLDCNSFSCH